MNKQIKPGERDIDSADDFERIKRHVIRFRRHLSSLGPMSSKIHKIAYDINNANQKKHKNRLNEIQRIHERNLRTTDSDCNRSLAEIQKKIDEIETEFDFPQKKWSDQSWQSFLPPDSLKSHRLFNIGEIRKETDEMTVKAPFLLPVMGGNNVLIKAAGVQKEQAIDLLQNIVLRMLVAVPAYNLKFCFIDPVGLGENFGRFMDLPDAVSGGRVWGERDHIRDQLRKLTEHVSLVTQKYLRNRFNNIEAYNKEVKEIEEPYRALVVSDFPEGFDDESAARLVSIAKNGVKTGVYVFVMVDPKKKHPYGYNPEDLERLCLNLEYLPDGSFDLGSLSYSGCVIRQGPLPDDALFDQIIHRIPKVSERTLREKVRVPFKEVVSWIKDRPWEGDSSEMISVPIGKTGAKLQQFIIGLKEHHALIAGKTGYGKSIFIHNLIISISLKYSPDDVEFYLIDFKEGVEFMKYATHQLPHARVVAVETEREFGLSILKKLEEEFKIRSEKFKSAGAGDISKLTDYNRKFPEDKLPRILLIVDEFQQLFTEDDNLSMRTLTILDRLVKQGRNVGINIILASQTMDRAIFIKGTANQMGLRIAFQCTDDDSRLILGEANPEARRLTRPGEGIYNDQTGAIEANSRFQGSWFSNEEIGAWLDQITEQAKKAAYEPPRRLIVFNGKTPGNILENEELMEIVARDAWGRPDEKCRVWLGESIAVKPDASAEFRRQGGSNLLLVGGGEKSILSMLLSSLLSIIAQQGPERAEFFFINPLGKGHPFYPFFSNIHLLLDRYSAMTVNIQREIPDMIGKIHQEFTRRLENMDSGTDGSIYIYILGVHRAAALRKRGYESSKEAAMLEEIFQDGPDLGIHTVIWAETNKSIDRVFDRAVNYFDQRVVQYMNSEDSSLLIETPLASRLNEFQAFLFDFNRPDGLEKFKPYDLYDLEVFKKIVARIRKKGEPT